MERKTRVLVIGGTGYVGSRLYDFLKEKGFEPDSVDICWFGNNSGIMNEWKDYSTLTVEDLSVYDAIVLLAGHSSVKMSGHHLSTLKNNVVNFVDLANKLMQLSSSPKLIYASSSSVYGDSKEKEVTEDSNVFVPNNYYDLSKHEIDLYAKMLIEQGKLEIYGLRFGTINGYSKNLRCDIMINAMFKSARETGEVNLFNPEVHRPILGLEDLCRAIEQIVLNGTRATSGLYNLASFNSTAREIAQKVAKELNAHIILQQPLPLDQCKTNYKLQSTAYNFSMNTQKFSKAFNFEFKDTIGSIVKSLKDNELKAIKTMRDGVRIYQ
jgi:nucleoside-diphosphate-sugar epimerase